MKRFFASLGIFVAVTSILPSVVLAQIGGQTLPKLEDCSKLDRNFRDFGTGEPLPGSLSANCYSPGQAVGRATRWGFILIGMLATLGVVIGGFFYITAAGDEKRAGQGKRSMMWSLIGLGLVLAAYAIVRITTQLVTGGTVF